MQHTRASIQSLLMQNDRAVVRALIVLNQRQTIAEQQAQDTILRNGAGFTPADARMGTSCAEYAQRTGVLSAKQVAYWRRPNRRGVPRICKYAGQLLQISQDRVTP